MHFKMLRFFSSLSVQTEWKWNPFLAIIGITSLYIGDCQLKVFLDDFQINSMYFENLNR
jgi:hypothetical protein